MASPDDLWLTDFGDPFPADPAHHRPALVIGPAAVFGTSFPFVIVVPATTTLRNLALHVELEPTPENGLHEITYLQCELLRSISRRRLVTRLGAVDSGASAAVHEIMRALLGC